MNCHQIYVKKNNDGKIQDGLVRKGDQMVPAVLHSVSLNDDPAASMMVPMTVLSSVRNIDSTSDEDDDGSDLVVSVARTSSAVVRIGESMHGESKELEPLKGDYITVRNESAKSQDMSNDNNEDERISRKSIETVVSSHHHQSVQGGKA